MRRIPYLVALWVVAGTVHGEVPVDPPAKAGATFAYVPSGDYETSRRAMNELMKQLDAGSYHFFIDKPQLSVSSEKTPIKWDWGEHGITVTMLRGSPPPMTFDYAAMPELGVIHDTILGASFYGVRVGDDRAIWCSTKSPNTRLVCGQWLAEAISAFRARETQVKAGREAFEAKFRETLAQYPDPSSRPPLPEDARRFKVQAEVAVNEKRIKDAIPLYNQALGIAPWWAEGFFNISLLFAEEKQYDGAIRNMKRYLLLMPDAPNAREAQDKIYEWEGKTNTSR